MADGGFTALLAHGASNQIALWTRERAFTYGELRDRIDLRARDLAAGGVCAGDRVALCLPAGVDFLTTVFACIERGATVTLLSRSLGPAARDHRIAELDPDLVIEPSVTLQRTPRRDTHDDDTPHLVLWTSGSTGLPRGVAFSPSALAWNARANAATLGLTADDCALVMLDITYSYALVHQVLSHWAVGGAVALADQRTTGFEPLGDWANDCRATTLAIVPSMVRMLPTLRGFRPRQISVGGAAAPEAALARIHSELACEVIATYGLTEAGPRVCTRRYDYDDSAAVGTVGTPLPGVEVTRTADGELWVATPSARRAVLVAGRFVPATRLVQTGDLGEVDADGRVRIVGRLRPSINRGGFKLFPGEIERVLGAQPGVLAARVVGRSHPRLGEVPHAFVVASGEGPSVSQLADACARELGAPWVPASIELVGELPAKQQSWKELAGE